MQRLGSCIHSVFMGALVLSALVGKLDASQETESLSQRDRLVISEAYRLWESYGEEFWKGWTVIEMPMIYIAGELEFAVNFAKAPAGFELTEETLLQRPVYRRKRQFPVGLAAAFPVGPTPCVVIGTPDAHRSSPCQWALTAVHEMFHVLQMNRGSMQKVAELEIVAADANDGMWQLNFPFPYKDANTMRLLHMDGYATYLAVETAKLESDVQYNLVVAMDARAVLKEWLESVTGDARAFHYAKFQEWKEGIARYTEYQMLKHAAGHEQKQSPELKKLEGYVTYQEIWESKYRQHANLFKHAGTVSRSRSEFYNLGMGKGMALDRLGVDWRERYFENGVWLDELLGASIEQAGRRCIPDDTGK